MSVSCLQGHALSFTNSTWQLLQHTTSAIKTWAQELLTRAWWRHRCGIIYTHTIYTHEVIYMYTEHTLTQSEAAFQCVGSPLEPWLDTVESDKQTLTQKGPFYLVLAKFFKISLLLYRCFFSINPFGTAGRRGRISFSLPEFSTANFSCCFNLWVKQIV